MYANNATHELNNIFFGYTLNELIGMFESCHNLNSSKGFYTQWCWPYDGSYLNQPKILTEIFTLIKQRAEVQIQKKIKIRMDQNKRNRG